VGNFLDSIWQELAESVGELLGMTLVAVAFAVLVIPIYLLMKWLSPQGRETTVKQDLLELVRMNQRTFNLFRSSTVTVQTSSPLQTIDENSLSRAQALLDDGLGLEGTCAQIEPGYLTWEPARQGIFREALQASLVLRKAAR